MKMNRFICTLRCWTIRPIHLLLVDNEERINCVQFFVCLQCNRQIKPNEQSAQHTKTRRRLPTVTYYTTHVKRKRNIFYTLEMLLFLLLFFFSLFFF